MLSNQKREPKPLGPNVVKGALEKMAVCIAHMLGNMINCWATHSGFLLEGLVGQTVSKAFLMTLCKLFLMYKLNGTRFTMAILMKIGADCEQSFLMTLCKLF